MEHLAEIIKSVTAQKKLNLSREARDIDRQWAEVAGEVVAAHAFPETIRNETLRVGVDSSVWFQHLHLLKPELLERMRAQYPELKIRDIRITLAPVSLNPTRKHTAGPVADLRHLTGRDKKMIETSAREIADEDLANLFRRIMTLEIARRRTRDARAKDGQRPG